MYQFTVLLVLVSLVSACATTPLPPEPSQDRLGVFQLKQQLIIEAGSARAYIQSGRQVDHPDHRDPVCVVQSWSVNDDQQQTVMPESFRISDVSARRGDVGSGFGVYGSTDLGMGVYMGMESSNTFGQPIGNPHLGGQSRMAQAASILRLVSERQPLIYKLTCFGAMGWMPFIEPPSIAEMNAVLGNVAHVDMNLK